MPPEEPAPAEGGHQDQRGEDDETPARAQELADNATPPAAVEAGVGVVAVTGIEGGPETGGVVPEVDGDGSGQRESPGGQKPQGAGHVMADGPGPVEQDGR